MTADYNEIHATIKAFTNFGEPKPYGHHPQIEITAYGVNTEKPLDKPVLLLASCRVIDTLEAESTPEEATAAAKTYLIGHEEGMWQDFISTYAE